MAKRSKRQRIVPEAVSPAGRMLFGLAVGLSVAVAVYVKDREPDAVAADPGNRARKPAGRA